MSLAIREIDHYNLEDTNHCDGEFTIDARLVVSYLDGEFHYSIETIPPTQKRYPLDEVDFSTYIDNLDKTIYYAYVDGQVAGQIRLSCHWNRYAYIEDIVVDRNYRRQGVGSELIHQAIRWAAGKRLAGVMLETQNNNVAGCRLYENCGFKIGGIDRCLYQGLDSSADEIALYWYYCFADNPAR
jgi:streptothricin acetyltransferase